jgi:hypothetical protein
MVWKKSLSPIKIIGIKNWTLIGNLWIVLGSEITAPGASKRKQRCLENEGQDWFLQLSFVVFSG